MNKWIVSIEPSLTKYRKKKSQPLQVLENEFTLFLLQ